MIHPTFRGIARTRVWWVVLIVGSALLAVWVAVPSARPIAAALLAPLPPLGVLTGVALFRPAGGRAWLTFGLGTSVIAVAVLGFALAGLLHVVVPTPSPLDGLLFVGLALDLIGLGWIVRGRVPIDRWDIADAAVLVIAFMLLAWFQIFRPALAISGLPSSAIAILVTYLAADVVFVVMAFFLIMTPGRRQPSFCFLLAAVLSVMASQILFSNELVHGTYRPGNLSELGWQAANLFWVLAATHPSMVRLALSAPSSGRHGVAPARFALIAAATLAAPAVLLLIGDPRQIDLPIVAVAAGGMFALVMARLYNAVRQLGRSLELRDRLEGELRDQALRDSLTSLPNRAMFTRQLEAALRTDPAGVAVLFCDLDDFKTINDTLGHAAGDELLIATAERFRRSVRPSDLAARLGGDEFGILLRGVPDPADAVSAAERVLALSREPLEIHGQTVYAVPSIGIAFGEPGGDPAEVLRNADIAMYLAKSQGKNQYELFRPALHAEVVSRLALRASLRHALEAKEFVVHYQPIVDLATERVVAVEALVRWQHPERGLVPPAEFIPAAEATGLIVPLGRWVLDTACRQLADWIARGTASEDLSITVNLSPAQLRNPDMVDHIRSALSESGLPASRLVLEVTEGVITDLDGALEKIEEIRGLGVHIAIDDFGTGYSSLSYLSRFPIDHIKIDRSFISALGVSERETTLTETVVQMAGQLNMPAIAEGIETRDQLQALQALGCPYGQGFLFSRAIDAVAIERLLGTPAHRRLDSRSVLRTPRVSLRTVATAATDAARGFLAVRADDGTDPRRSSRSLLTAARYPSRARAAIFGLTGRKGSPQASGRSTSSGGT